MKKAVLFLLFSGFLFQLPAQVPEYLSYQAIVLDGSYHPLQNQPVSFRMSILKGSTSGTVMYSELQNTTTTELGLVTLMIGNGTGKTGNFTTIDWASDRFYIKVEVDKTGGTNYEPMGVSRLLSVPYSLSSKDINLRVSVIGDSLFIGRNHYVIVPGVSQANLSSKRIFDGDGNEYHYVMIGDQAWLTENLKTTKFNDGSQIQIVTDKEAWNLLTTPGMCWYNNDEASNKSVYGGLYNWYAMYSGKLCPKYWHVSTEADWLALIEFLGQNPSEKLKEAGTVHWEISNNGWNTTGFNALPGGLRLVNDYLGINSRAVFGTGDYYPNSQTETFVLFGMTSDVLLDLCIKTTGVSVRCVIDY